jgi:outer membrane biosynthesis protein TonB
MNLNRSQLSLLITFLSMSLLVLSLYNIHLGSKEKEEYIIELSLAEEELLEKIIEEEEKAEEPQNPGQSKSNLAYNETAKPSLGNPEPLKTLEELMDEQETASNSEEDTDYLSSETGYGASLKKLARQRMEAKQKIGELEAKKEAMTSFSKRNTTVSYSLLNRNHYDLPIPVYTCIEGGKIVVNIKVDAFGKVTEAEVNKKSSNTLNGCLVDNAITYALKARFDGASRAEQRGTITYLFQGK